MNQKHIHGKLLLAASTVTTPEPSAEVGGNIQYSLRPCLEYDSGSEVSTLRAEHIAHKPQGLEIQVEDGGPRAWITVVGAWLVLFASIGNIYSFGVYQDFYTRVFLRGFTPSQIGWMGSVQMMLPFAGGLVAGKLFDAGHFHQLVITGSTILVFSMFMLSLVHEGQYYQVFLSHGVGIGVGAGLVFAPTTGVVSLHFTKRKNLAYGTALTGASMGAVVIPIALNHLIPRIGFGAAIRIIGYMTLGCFVVGNSLMRLPRDGVQRRKGSSDVNILGFFRDPAYVVFIFGSTLVALGIYFPLIYMQLYSVEHHVDSNIAFYSLAIINGSSSIGRIAANYLADIYGIWNLQVPTTLLAGVCIWTLLLVKDTPSLVVVSVFYGIFSGAWLSLTMGGLASFASTPQEVGARIGIAMAIGSLGLLGSIPAQGALLSSQFIWIRPVVFSSTMMFAATAIYFVTRMLVSRRKGTERV